MARCPNCGAQIAEGVSYCQECGAALSSATPVGNRTETFVGEVRKCPNCGEVLSFDNTHCPACGLEINGQGNVTTVDRLSRQLQDIEKSSASVTESNRRKAEAIRTFAVPNTREGLFEFMVLATTNVDTTLVASAQAKGTSGLSEDELSRVELSNAWLTQAEQVYQKATFLLGDEGSSGIRTVFLDELSSVCDPKFLPDDIKSKELLRRGKLLPNIPTPVMALIALALCIIWQMGICGLLGLPKAAQGIGDVIIITIVVAASFQRDR